MAEACENLDEAYAYVMAVANMRGTVLHAAVAGWDYPLSAEAILLLDLIDLTGMVNVGKKWKPLRRPWKVKGVDRLGTALPRDEAVARLRANAGR